MHCPVVQFPPSIWPTIFGSFTCLAKTISLLLPGEMEEFIAIQALLGTFVIGSLDHIFLMIGMSKPT
jgi:hypothetical protein